jgi:hypothetical protein
MYSILFIGGTGAQGARVVQPALGIRQVRYQDPDSPHQVLQAQELAALPNVRLLAAPDSYTVESLTQAFESVELAFVNTDDFAVGEQAETYWSIRMFELATRAGVKHFVYSSLDAVYKKSGYDPKYYVGHYEGKSRVAGALALPTVLSLDTNETQNSWPANPPLQWLGL